MMLFSIIGVGGFLQSLYVKPFPHAISRFATLDLLGLLGIALTPFIMFILRILPLNIRLPFNVIFVTTTIGFIFHFVQYLKDHSRSGFPLHANLISLIILDIENQTVLSGYTTSDIPETKLHGMAMLAVDNLMKQILGYSSSQDLPRYLGNYGDILFINEDNFMLIASFSGMGKKIGRYVLSRLIQEYIKRMNNSLPIHFKELVEYYIHPYTHKKHELVPIEYYTIENSSKLDT